MSTDKVVNFLYDTWGTPKTENIEALTEVIECWERGDGVYIKNNMGGKWVQAPTPATKPSTAGVPYPTVQQKPDWTCGCGTTLHGDEALCWRCGAHAKRP